MIEITMQLVVQNQGYQIGHLKKVVFALHTIIKRLRNRSKNVQTPSVLGIPEALERDVENTQMSQNHIAMLCGN